MKEKKPPSGDAKKLQKEMEKLQQQFDEVRKEKNDLFEKLQRVSADYANFQKRTPKQISEAIAYNKESIIKTLLPSLDNFEHTLKGMDNSKPDDEHVKGVRIVYEHVLDVLKSHGVQKIESLGKVFDPAVHQAMIQQEEKDKDEGIILEEFQSGYKLNGRVIRPAMVVVNKYKPAVEEAEPEEKSETEQNGSEDKEA